MSNPVRVAVIVETDEAQVNIVINPKEDERGIQQIIEFGLRLIAAGIGKTE
jgi:hypothetical protein